MLLQRLELGILGQLTLPVLGVSYYTIKSKC